MGKTPSGGGGKPVVASANKGGRGGVRRPNTFFSARGVRRHCRNPANTRQCQRIGIAVLFVLPVILGATVLTCCWYSIYCSPSSSSSSLIRRWLPHIWFQGQCYKARTRILRYSKDKQQDASPPTISSLWTPPTQQVTYLVGRVAVDDRQPQSSSTAPLQHPSSSLRPTAPVGMLDSPLPRSSPLGLGDSTDTEVLDWKELDLVFTPHEEHEHLWTIAGQTSLGRDDLGNPQIFAPATTTSVSRTANQTVFTDGLVHQSGFACWIEQNECNTIRTLVTGQFIAESFLHGTWCQNDGRNGCFDTFHRTDIPRPHDNNIQL